MSEGLGEILDGIKEANKPKGPSKKREVTSGLLFTLKINKVVATDFHLWLSGYLSDADLGEADRHTLTIVYNVFGAAIKADALNNMARSISPDEVSDEVKEDPR